MKSGIIIPNLPFIDEVFELVRAFTHDSVMVGLDPLRLAIVGSQLDDEIAQVGVNVLNNLATNINKDSGVVALSHATKEGSKNRPDSYIQASTHTSGSVVWSQHARSNFSAARLPAEQCKKLFGDKLSAMDIEKQRVMELTHGRLSHGAEDETRYMLMNGGLLLPIEPAKGRTINEEIDTALPVVARAIKQILDAGTRASQTAVRHHEQVQAALGADKKIRAMLEKLVDKGYVEFTGGTTLATGAVTKKGDQRLAELERVAKYHESTRVMQTGDK